MHKVVVNSTPLIVLSNIGYLELLKKMYKKIYIPESVFREITAKQDSACHAVKNHSDWILVKKIKDTNSKRMYQARLHDGEVEVMILAQEEPTADLVIIDDNAAKKTAKFLGLNVTGTLGVLVKAKKLGLIDHVSIIIEKLISNNFYISDEVINFIKNEVDE